MRKPFYPSRAHALRALRKFCAQSEDFIRLEPGKVVTDAEIWLLQHFDKYPPKVRRPYEMSRKQMRKLVGIAKVLGLYPEPDWWLVMKKMNEATQPGYDEVPF